MSDVLPSAICKKRRFRHSVDCVLSKVKTSRDHGSNPLALLAVMRVLRRRHAPSICSICSPSFNATEESCSGVSIGAFGETSRNMPSIVACTSNRRSLAAWR